MGEVATVAELLTRLADFMPSMVVVVYDDDNDSLQQITAVETDKPGEVMIVTRQNNPDELIDELVDNTHDY